MSIITRTLRKGTYGETCKPPTKWQTAQQKTHRHCASRRLRTNEEGPIRYVKPRLAVYAVQANNKAGIQGDTTCTENRHRS